ncbi:hypothetical protein LTR53_012239, partial [Teratosphaeriaceae sp. CCFEE 6253]
FRTILLLCCGCTTFFVLHNAVGGLSPPSAGSTPTFPRKIWQSWKLDPLRFEARDAERAMTWTLKNPAHRYEVLTDDNAETYVDEHFGPRGFNRPDIVSIYKGLRSLRIIQADLLRYLIMYTEGGVWADIDVEALESIEHFVPKRHRESDIGMVIGIETDEPALKDHPFLGAKAQSFCQWTFMCKPRLKVMMRLIDNILIWLSTLALEQGKPISELRLSFDEVLNGTGPSAFTSAILAEMSVETGRRMTWADFTGLEESWVVGNVLVLTSQAFAAGTGHSKSGNHHGKGALVKHHFHASPWTTNHPRFKHPIYGEVEKCNWDVECVKLWDANTAFFASLPKDDQTKMIELKDREDAAVAKQDVPELPLAMDLGLPPGPEDDPVIALDGSLSAPAPAEVPAGSVVDLLESIPVGDSQTKLESLDVKVPGSAPAGILAGLTAGLAEGLPETALDSKAEEVSGGLAALDAPASGAPSGSSLAADETAADADAGAAEAPLLVDLPADEVLEAV